MNDAQHPRKGKGPGGGQFDTVAAGENTGVALLEHPSMTKRVVYRFVEMKLASAAKMARRGEEDGWGGMGPGLSAGWRDAEADIAFRLAINVSPDEQVAEAAAEMLSNYQAEPGSIIGLHRVPKTKVDELAQYALDRVMAEHVTLMAARAENPTSREGDTACGLRNGYALSYAQLSLGDVDARYAHTVADRLTSALYEGETDPDELHCIAWDVKYPIDDWDDEDDSDD